MYNSLLEVLNPTGAAHSLSAGIQPGESDGLTNQPPGGPTLCYTDLKKHLVIFKQIKM